MIIDVSLGSHSYATKLVAHVETFPNPTHNENHPKTVIYSAKDSLKMNCMTVTILTAKAVIYVAYVTFRIRFDDCHSQTMQIP